ncbi:MAG: hypothetical protein ACI88S_000936, partial [Ilumatobacter sp.]
NHAELDPAFNVGANKTTQPFERGPPWQPRQK